MIRTLGMDRLEAAAAALPLIAPAHNWRRKSPLVMFKFLTSYVVHDVMSPASSSDRHLTRRESTPPRLGSPRRECGVGAPPP
jgi:hypothetical protein